MMWYDRKENSAAWIEGAFKNMASVLEMLRIYLRCTKNIENKNKYYIIKQGDWPIFMAETGGIAEKTKRQARKQTKRGE